MRQRVVPDPGPSAVHPDAVAPSGEAGHGVRFEGFAPVPAPSPNAGSALWRRWMALQRVGDSAAETQVCLRPPASGARRATPAFEAELVPRAVARVDPVFVVTPFRGAEAARCGRAPEAAVAQPAARAHLDLASLLAPLRRAAQRAISRCKARRRSPTGHRTPSTGMARAARRAGLFGLGAVCVGALAAWRPSSSDASARAERSLVAASQLSRPSEPSPPPRHPSVLPPDPVTVAHLREPGTAAAAAARDGHVAGLQGAPVIEPPNLERLARLAVDALAAGDGTSAAAHYRELARLAPENAAFAAAARILARPAARSR